MNWVTGTAVAAGAAVGVWTLTQILQNNTGHENDQGALKHFSEMQRLVTEFQDLANQNPANQQLYFKVVAAAEDLAMRLLHFQRVDQFACNRAISRLKTACSNLCHSSLNNTNTSYLQHDVLPNLESHVADLLHNAILDD